MLAPFLPFAFLTLSWAASPPDDLVIIHPGDGASLSVNQTVLIGVYEPSPIPGVLQNITIDCTFPNGTTATLMEAWGGCGSPVAKRDVTDVTITTKLDVNQIGMYLLLWNMTYVMSSDPSKANATYCGPLPLSYQSFIVKSNFTAQTSSMTVGEEDVTQTVTFSSQPTGTIPSGGTSVRGTGMTVLLVVVGLVLVFCREAL